MTRFRGPFKRLEEKLSRAEPIKPGLYHYQSGNQYGARRFHLRVEEDGRGLLLVDASKVLHLNQTAMEYAKLILEGASEEMALKRMASRYRVDPLVVKSDYESMREKIEAFGAEEKICPVSYLGIERIKPFETPVSSPYRMDLALTYRCNNDCVHCYVERERNFPEIQTGKWKEILDKVWEIGIPHVVFTGGEATLRDDLIDLIQYAEDIGLVTGLLTNGRLLGLEGFVEKLTDAGLDHVQVTIESHVSDVHDRIVGSQGAWEETARGLEAAIASPIYTITNTTLTSLNKATIPETVDFLHSIGLETIAMNGVIYTGGAKGGEIGIPEDEMSEILVDVLERVGKHGMRFIWYTPTRYCKLDPISLGLGPKQCTAGKYNMCVEPNGDVIPCQSYFHPVGNILEDNWGAVWNSSLLKDLRERKFAPPECFECETFSLCGAGCPLAGEAGTLHCIESKSSG